MGVAALNPDIKELIRRPLLSLVAAARKISKAAFADKLEICRIANIKSGLCCQDCKFCAQSAKYATAAKTYPLWREEEIFAAAANAYAAGTRRLGLVASGRRLSPAELDIVLVAARRIKREFDIKLCASLGSLGKPELNALNAAGLDRYHHNIESAPSFYPRLVSTHNIQERIDTVRAAKAAGLEICCGGILGVGESWEQRIEMAYLLRDLGVDSIPLNFLIPIAGTPLGEKKPLSAAEAIRIICLFRIILPDKSIKIIAGRETVLGDFQGLAFLAGVNGMMLGGYLTVGGRGEEADQRLIKEVEQLWKE